MFENANGTVQQWNIPPAVARLPWDAVRSHNITRYRDQMAAAIQQYIEDMRAALAPQTTPFNGPPLMPMNYVRRNFLENQGDPLGELVGLTRVLTPGAWDSRTVGVELAVPPPYSQPATEVATRAGMLTFPYRTQRHPHGWPTILPLRDRLAPPGAMYDGSAQALAMQHLDQQAKTSLAPMTALVDRFQKQSVGGR